MMQVKEKKMIRKIGKLRDEKLTIGSLIRIVRSNKYENISDDLIEVEQLKKRIPSLKGFSKYFDDKRDESRMKGKQRSPLLETPAFKMKV